MWDSLTDAEKVAQVRREVEAQRFKAHDWEEALDQVVEEKHKLRCALMDILLTWNLTTGLVSMENVLQRAREVLDATDAKHS